MAACTSIPARSTSPATWSIPATGAVALRARVPNPEHTLLPGTFVTLKATLGEQREAYRVPQVAVQRDTQGAYVLVVGKDGKVARKDVAADRLDGSDWIVGSGVAAGDRVIVSGLQRAQPGQPAKAVPWTPEQHGRRRARPPRRPRADPPCPAISSTIRCSRG